MQHTPNYNLNKPEGNDYAKIESLNVNADIIDAELKSLNDAIGSGTGGDTILARLKRLEEYVGNLANLETTQKANLVAAINEVRRNLMGHIDNTDIHVNAEKQILISNSVQKNVTQADNIFRNLGRTHAEKTIVFPTGGWQGGTSNAEILYLVIPIGFYWGSVKITISSQFANSNAGGSVQATYQIGRAGVTSYVNTMQIDSISTEFAKNYKLLPAVFRNSDFLIPIVKAPTGQNSLSIHLEAFESQELAAAIKDTKFILDSTGVNNYYPFTPQLSRADEVYNQLFQSVSNKVNKVQPNWTKIALQGGWGEVNTNGVRVYKDEMGIVRIHISVSHARPASGKIDDDPIIAYLPSGYEVSHYDRRRFTVGDQDNNKAFALMHVEVYENKVMAYSINPIPANFSFVQITTEISYKV